MKKKLMNCRVLLIHPEPGKPGVRALADLLENAGCAMTVSPDNDAAVSIPNLHRYQLIIAGDGLMAVSLPELLRKMRGGMLSEGVPLIVLSGGRHGCETSGHPRIDGADAVIAESAGPTEISALAVSLIQRQRQSRLDPVSGLVAGPFLDHVLDRLCSRTPFSWHFLEIKLLSLMSINLHYGYDVGDELIAKLAEMLDEEVHGQGTETDFAGRLYGTRFCVVTKSRNADSLCRGIINKSGRAFRKFYTPFDWMKGHLTIDGGRHAGDYHLCDVVIAALQIPPNWDNNRAYLLDVADDVLMQIPKSKGKYLIVNP